jgi:hypothetical protein
VTVIKRPTRSFSFTDWTKSHPRDQHPGDRLDAMFIELTQAIQTTQDALAEIRQPNGTLKPQSVGPEHFRHNFIAEVTDAIAKTVEPVRAAIRHAAENVQEYEKNAALYAKDAEAAVSVAKELVNGLNALRQIIEQHSGANTKAANDADTYATDSENWANYSQAMADNAIAAKDEALAWAEFLAGPVVNPADAPAYIAGSKWPHGLYYQPVHGSQMAGLWSAKWWAIYAQQLVGGLSTFYLGGWAEPPLPGEVNPDNGMNAPNPIPPGSLYFNTSDDLLYVWNGIAWIPSSQLAHGYASRFVYTAATNGQTVFSGADDNGMAPAVLTSPSDVHLNGVKLVEGHDFAIDKAANKLTLTGDVAAGSVVQWDLLVPPENVAPGAVLAWKIQPITPDGTTQNFPLKYQNAVGAIVDANVGTGAQLALSQDGVIQEAGKDFTATGNNVHFGVAPPADAHIWMVWFQPGTAPP